MEKKGGNLQMIAFIFLLLGLICSLVFGISLIDHESTTTGIIVLVVGIVGTCIFYYLTSSLGDACSEISKLNEKIDKLINENKQK